LLALDGITKQKQALGLLNPNIQNQFILSLTILL
jgi:hypothetical protein